MSALQALLDRIRERRDAPGPKHECDATDDEGYLLSLVEKAGEMEKALERMLEAAPQAWDHPKAHQLFLANRQAHAALAAYRAEKETT